MTIMIVDDSSAIRSIIKAILNEAGYSDLLFAESGEELFEQLNTKIDLIILDIILPNINGIDICRTLKSKKGFKDVPVVMVTALTETEPLEQAFAAGAIDYITKPINKVELLARINSILKLKHETDQRKAREKKLIEVTQKLEAAVKELNQLSSLDGLTGISNRRHFDQYINLEWKRGKRNLKPLSIILADIDFFKNYNDTYGHQAGDNCLKEVAVSLKSVLRRPGDMVFRYGGEEFAVVLPETPKGGAIVLAQKMCQTIQSLNIEHQNSEISSTLTLSLGVSSSLPASNLTPEQLIYAADQALYSAKHEGRNCVKFLSINN